MRLIDLSNKKIGRLLVIKRSKNIGKHPSWLCKCKCGNETVVRGDHLRGGLIRSCGCLEEENKTNIVEHKRICHECRKINAQLKEKTLERS